MKIVRNFVLVALAKHSAKKSRADHLLLPLLAVIVALILVGRMANAANPSHSLDGIGLGSNVEDAVHVLGFTVYVFDLDLTNPGQSTCNAGNGCSLKWPPVRPPAGATLTGKFAQIDRTDGTKQLTYAGRPLYTFVADLQPRQTTGDGLVEFGGVWHIARPQESTPEPSAMTPGNWDPRPMPGDGQWPY